MATVAQLEAIITADTSQFDSAVEGASQKLESLGQSAGQASEGVGRAAEQLNVAGGLMAAAGAAITAPFIGAVKQAADFEFAMDGVNAALGGMDTATMDLLADQAMDLGSASKFSATEIAGVQEELAKSGLEAEDLLGGATKAVTDLAAATGEALLPSTHLVSDAINAFGLEGKDATRVADIFTTALNESSMGTSDLQRGLNYLGPVLANQNQYLEMTAQGLNGNEEALIDASAALAVFNQRGLKGADVGVSLARMYDELTTGGEDATNALAAYGVEALDAQGNFLPLPDILDNVGKALSGLSDAERANAIRDIFGAESKDVVEQMIRAFQDGGLGDEFRDIAEAMHEEGIAAEQAAIRQDNLTSAVEQLGGSLNNLGIAMGTPLLDPLKNITQGITDVTDALAGAPPEVQNLVSKFAALGGGLLTVGGLAAIGTGQVLKLGQQFAGAGLSLKKFAAGFGIAGLAIGAGLLAYETNFMGFGDFVDAKMAEAGHAVDMFGSRFDASFNARKAQGANDLAAAVGGFGDALKVATGIDILPWTEKAATAIDAFGDAFAHNAENVDPLVNGLMSLGYALNEIGYTDAAKTMYRVAKAAQAMHDKVTEATEAGIGPAQAEMLGLIAAADDLLGTDIGGFFDDLGSNARRAADDLGALGGALRDGNIPEALDIIAGEGTRAQDLFNSLGAALRDGTNGLGTFKDQLLAGDWSGAWDSITGGLDAVGQKIGEFNPGLLSAIEGVGAFKDSLTSGDWGGAWDQITGGLDAVQQKLGEVDLGPALQGVSDQVTDWFDGVGDMLMGSEALGPGDKGAVQGLVPQLTDSLVGGIEQLGPAVMDKLGSIPNPMDAVGQWLMDGVNEVNRFFQPQEMAAGLGGAGMGDTSGISQMFSGMVDGIEAGAAQAVADLGALKDEKLTDISQALGDFLGPIGQFLFPSQDAKSAPLADPGKIGEQFGQQLVETFKSGEFTDALKEQIDTLPPETFQATGAALLGAINNGMTAAMDQPVPTDGATSADAAGQTMGQQMVSNLATGLTTALGAEGTKELFLPVASAMGGVLNTALGEVMNTAWTPPGQGGMVGADAAGGIGAQMVKSLATGLTTSLQEEGTVEHFLPVANALGQVLNTAMNTAGTGAEGADPGATGVEQTSGFGQQMVQGLASGLANGITAADPAMFVPVTNALGTQLGNAMMLASQETQAPGGVGPAGPAVPAMGNTMVQGLATGLANGITAADPAMFVPVSNALGTQLGAAMSLASQQTTPPGGVGPAGPAPAVSGMGTSMVQGLATGLTDSITAADPAMFVPVSNALGTQLGAAMSMASQQTAPPGGVGPAGPAVGGMGTDMVTGLATGLTDSITNAPVETFAPVGQALGAKMGEALQGAVESGAQGAAGGAGGDSAGVGAQLGESVSMMMQSGIDQADFEPVGTSLSTKMSESLQTAVSEGASGDMGAQMGESITEALNSAVEGADFSGVGEAIGEKLTEALDTAISDAAEGIEEAMSGVTDAITEAVDQMGEAISEATEAVSQGVEEMASALDEAISSVDAAIADLQAAVEEATAGIEAAVQAAVEALSEIGAAAEEAASAVSSAMASMAASVEGAVGAITAAAGQIVAALNQIAAAAGAIGGMAGSALGSGFADATGIASPSKMFLKHGQMITQGLAIGMRQGQGIPKAAKDLAGLSMSAVGDAIGMGSPAKKFVPHGASITDGMMQGMLDQAKGRMQSAMGKMAGAVEGGMGKVKSAMSSAMARVKGESEGQAAAAGAGAATAAAEGMSREDRQVERAARKMWRKAYRELVEGAGAARFLGEEWSREFWEGMLDSSGSLEFAKYVTAQIVSSAEDAVTAAMGKVKGLATQLEIVASAISDIEGDITDLESELAGIDQRAADQSQQARVSSLQAELRFQQQITKTLNDRLKTEVSSAHQAHIRAVQAKSAGAQADYEHKLRVAQATHTAAAESAEREKGLQTALDAMQNMMRQATQDEVTARRAAIVEELAMRREQLAHEKAMQANLLAAQQAAQEEYTNAVVAGSNERMKQLKKEMRQADSPEEKATLRGQLALEQQRVETANQLAAALEAQATASNPEAMAQANAQVQYLTEQLTALGEVDVSSLLSEIVSSLEEASASMTSAATSLDSAATAMGSMDAAAGMKETTAAVSEAGAAATDTGEKMFDMAAKWKEVQDKMSADQLAFNEEFAAMVDAQRGTAVEGAEDIGLALSEGITGRITAGGPATQQAMLASLQGGVEATEEAATKGADSIATAFGASMRGQLGVELPKVHQDILTGMTKATGDAAKVAEDGGKQAMTDYGTAALGKLEQDSGRIQNRMTKTVEDPIKDMAQIANRGGNDIGKALGDGMEKGLQGMASQIANTTKRTVNDAIHAGRQAADAHSPSRKMMELGDDMGLGLLLGLTRRQGDAEDASARLVHIPMSPTSSGGVAGRRAYEERGGGTTVHIEHLELPSVTNPQEFVAIMERLAAMNGVASGRR